MTFVKYDGKAKNSKLGSDQFHIFHSFGNRTHDTPTGAGSSVAAPDGADAGIV